MSLLPSRPDAEPAEDAGPRVIGVDDADADDVLAALSSGTARSLLAALHDEPAAPSELADRVDTSLQNVQYHLEKLEGAGAVEVVDTAYSTKGREMDLYAPADQPLVIFAGDDEHDSTLRTALRRLLGAVGLLAAASVLVQAAYGTLPLPSLGFGSGDGGQAPRAGGGDGGDGGGGADGGDGGGGFQAQDVETATATEPSATSTPVPEETEAKATEATQTTTDAMTETAPDTMTETAAGTPTDTVTDAVNRTFDTAQTTVTEATQPAAEGAAGLPPGLLFFAGGLFAIAVVAGVLYVRDRP